MQTDRQPRRALAVVLIVLLAGCAATSGGAAEDVSSVEDTGTDADTPAVEEAAAVVEQLGAAMAAGDMSTAVSVTAGPVAEWLEHVLVVSRATDDVPFARVNTSQATQDPRGEDGRVVFGGPLVYGPENPPPPPRVLTDITVEEQGGEWVVTSLNRNDIPIDDYVGEPGDGAPVSSDGVTGRVVTVFHDASCATDPDCPPQGAETVAIDVELENTTDMPLEVVEFWLETPAGRIDAIEGAVTELPPGGTGVGTAGFPAVNQLEDGATLQLRLEAGDAPIELALAVPRFPAA